MPRPRFSSCLPGFGMYTRLTGFGRYRLVFMRSTRSCRFSSRFVPYASTVTPSMPHALSRLSARLHCARFASLMWCTHEVNFRRLSRVAFSVISLRIVFNEIKPQCVSSTASSICRFIAGRFPLYVAFPRAEYSQPVRLLLNPPSFLVSFDLSSRTPRLLRVWNNPADLPSAHRPHLVPCRCLRPPIEPVPACQCAGLRVVFRCDEGVNLYNVSLYGAQYIPLRYGLIRPSPWLHRVRRLPRRKVWFCAGGYPYAGWIFTSRTLCASWRFPSPTP